jgi:hypothetical protein
LTPSSAEVGSAESRSSTGTTVFAPQIEQGQFTETDVTAPGVWRLPLSSAARTLSVVEGLPCAVQL